MWCVFESGHPMRNRDMNEFKEFLKSVEDEIDLFNSPEEAMKLAWEESRNQAFLEAERMGEVNLFQFNRRNQL